jgi:type VI protein secretion system component VasF
MSVQAAEKLLADPVAEVDSLLEVITWLTRDISNLRARKECAQSQEMIDQIAEEISRSESALDKIKKEIVRRCS